MIGDPIPVSPQIAAEITVGPNDCPAERDGYACCRTLGHRGMHVATGLNVHAAYRVWPPLDYLPNPSREGVTPSARSSIPALPHHRGG